MEHPNPQAWIFLEENWPDRWPVAGGWPGLVLEIDGQETGFSGAAFEQRKQKAHILEGWVERWATAHLPGGKILNIHTKQFSHLAEEGCSALRFSLTPVNFSGKARLGPLLDFSEKCSERPAGPVFIETGRETDFDSAGLLLETADGQQRMAAAFRFTAYQDGEEIDFASGPVLEKAGRAGRQFEVDIEPLQETVLFRFDSVFVEKKRTRSRILEQTVINVNRLFVRGFQQLLLEQSAGWSQFWHNSELDRFAPTKAAQPLFMNIWQLLDGWPDAPVDATALFFLCEKAAPVFMRKTLIDRHLRSSRAMHGPVLCFVVGEYLRRTGCAKGFLEKGLETLITACRFWFESGGTAPREMMERNIENLALAIAAAKRTDPETWRSLMIRFRFEEKREPRKWLEKLRGN